MTTQSKYCCGMPLETGDHCAFETEWYGPLLEHARQSHGAWVEESLGEQEREAFYQLAERKELSRLQGKEELECGIWSSHDFDLDGRATLSQKTEALDFFLDRCPDDLTASFRIRLDAHSSITFSLYRTGIELDQRTSYWVVWMHCHLFSEGCIKLRSYSEHRVYLGWEEAFSYITTKLDGGYLATVEEILQKPETVVATKEEEKKRGRGRLRKR